MFRILQSTKQSKVVQQPDGLQQVEGWLLRTDYQDYQELRKEVDQWAVIEQRMAFVKVCRQPNAWAELSPFA